MLIYGLGSSTRDWEFQVPEFSKSFRVITYDLRGHGRSNKPVEPYRLPLLAADLAGLLQALRIPSAHLVGISLGGTPEQARQEIERRVGIVQQLGMRAMGEALSPALFPKPEQAALRETFVARWAENDPRAYIEATRSMLGWNVLDQLGAVGCPTLILAADPDYTPVAAKEAYVRLIPDARLVVIPETHHAMPLERPEKFNAAVTDFLADHR